MEIQIIPYREEFREQVIAVWERSATATHHFVKPADLDYYKSVVITLDFQALGVYCSITAEGKVSGFIGVAEHNIETLFIEPAFIGKGLGKALMEFALKELKATQVDVNEQNINAVKFYTKFGFKTYERTEKDSEGKEYPLLKMRIAEI